MAEPFLIDFSWTKPPAAAVKAAGYSGVIGYISHDRSGKDLSAAQARAYRKAGLSVGFVFETTAGRAKAGKAAGVADRNFAEAEAKRRGYPAGAVIFYAVDFDAKGSQILPYFRGIASGTGRYGWGAYGSDDVVDAVNELGPDAAWQTGAWSGIRVSPNADLYQRTRHTRPPIKGVKGSAYDENVLIRPVRLWGANPKPHPKPDVVGGNTGPLPPTRKGIPVAHYKKALVAILGAVTTWALASLPDGTVTPTEWAALAPAILTALGVYQVTNKPKRTAK